VYGEAARELDIAFLFGFLLTTGGWAAVFLIIDRVAKFLGWKRGTPTSQAATADRAADTPVATPPMPVERPVTPIHRRASRRPRR
jgi:hypothetical protein